MTPVSAYANQYKWWFHFSLLINIDFFIAKEAPCTLSYNLSLYISYPESDIAKSIVSSLKKF